MSSHTENHEAEILKLDGTTEEQIGNLKLDFAAIVTETRRCLRDRYSNPEDAASWLNEILRGTQDEPLVIYCTRYTLIGDLAETTRSS